MASETRTAFFGILGAVLVVLIFAKLAQNAMEDEPRLQPTFAGFDEDGRLRHDTTVDPQVAARQAAETARLQQAAETARLQGERVGGFERFDRAFRAINNDVAAQTGIRLYGHAQYMGDGIVNVTVADVWLTAAPELQEASYQTLANLWRAADTSDLPVFLNIVDERGNMVR